MVRFFSRPFFHRKRSEANTVRSHAADTDAASFASSATPSVYSARPDSSTARHARRSTSSLARRLGRHNGAAEVPEPVPEQRESLFLFAQDDVKSPQVSTDELPTPSSAPSGSRLSGSGTLAGEGEPGTEQSTPNEVASPGTAANDAPQENTDGKSVNSPPEVVVHAPTPGAEETYNPIAAVTEASGTPLAQVETPPEDSKEITISLSERPRRSSSDVSPRHNSTAESEPDLRRQSIVNSANAKIVKTLVDVPEKQDSSGLDTDDSAALPSAVLDLFTPGLPNMAQMLNRKIWVRRPGGSATLVQIKEDDLVDDVRDMILKKYANSLGKTFDSPDMLLRIISRGDHGQPRTDRVLGPEEQMCRTIDTNYPGGQTVDDALVIDVPPKRTPRPSPRVHAQQYLNYPAMEDHRPVESGTDYFPPMPAIVHPTMPQTASSHDSRANGHGEHHRSISVLNTGQLPLLPSPGGTARRHRAEREHRPRFTRQQTSSPTIVQHPSNAGVVAVDSSGNLIPQAPAQVAAHRGSLRPRTESISSEHPNPHGPNGAVAAAPIPTPPALDNVPSGSNPPTPASSAPGSHLQRPARAKKSSKKPNSGYRSRKERNGTSESPQPSAISSMLDASIPPINVLIVEDNIINLRILEGLMKRLKVRWETAMNGQIAVDKWRGGGFHLVLMDIQMPVMNGLAATKEIRRLEKVNGIGVFSSSAPSSPVEHRKQSITAEQAADEDEKEAAIKRKKSADKLPEATGGLFKSPIIIVALTASSLQSDRHEALAAGCNDFLTKPVNFVWLERKVKEWGCMQALIDFDGWRRWKDYASKEEAGKSEEQKRAEAEKEEKQKRKMEKLALLQEKQRVKKEADEAKKKAEREKAEREAPAAPAVPEGAGGGEASPTAAATDSTDAEVKKEKEEIDMEAAQADANGAPAPGPDAEPPAVLPETIEEEK